MACSEDLEYTCTLDEETLEIAKKELNEDPSTRLLEIKTLRDRLEQYPGLKARLDPHFLLRFLRARKFDQERAFELVLNYYRMRKQDPAIFDGLKPSNVAHVYMSNVTYPHTHRDRLGRKIYFQCFTRMDTSRYNVVDVLKVEFLNMMKLIESERTQVCGFTILADFEGFGMSNLLQLNTDLTKRIVRLWQDAFPVRLKNVLLVNEPPFVDMVVSLFTQFAKAKMVRRIRFIGKDWKKLHEYIDPACLPACYGGTLKEGGDPQKWTELMMQCDRQLEEESKFGFLDYTLRPDLDQKEQDAFSHMAGTFKKLDL